MAKSTGTTFDRPIAAKLIVRLDNGEEWEPTPDDLAKFGLARKLDIYIRVADLLAEGLSIEHRDDLTNHEGPNLVRYLIECAVMYDHSPWADEKGEPWPEDETEGLGYQAQLRAVVLEDIPDPAGAPTGSES